MVLWLAVTSLGKPLVALLVDGGLAAVVEEMRCG